MRRVKFAVGEMYHIYNRGVDKRSLFTNKQDLERFIACVILCNQIEPIVSFHELLGAAYTVKLEDLHAESSPLVRIHTYCINLNHYHFLLEPCVTEGVQKFMHRLATAYTMYFNETNDRSGSLFQGPYKAVHVVTDAYYMHIGAYVTYNDVVHGSKNPAWFSTLPYSAVTAYAGQTTYVPVYTQALVASCHERGGFLHHAKKTATDVYNLRQSTKMYKSLCLE